MAVDADLMRQGSSRCLMLHADLDPLLRFRYVEFAWLFYLTIAWFLAWGGHAIVAWIRRDDPTFHPLPWHRILGIVLIIWPFVQFGHNIYLSIDRVFTPGTVSRTVPAEQWWATAERRWWQYVVLPLSGMFLAYGLHERLYRPPHLGVRLRRLLVHTRIWPMRSLTRDLANGAWLFVGLYAAYGLLFYLLSPLRQYDTGDSSQVFLALTPLLAFVLALTAGVTEELLFRGILQTQLRRIMPVASAIFIQAIFFGLIHAGYGNFSQILFPTLFGIAMGLLVLRFGLIPAIMVHAGVNLIIFLATISTTGYPWTLDLIGVIFVVSIVFPASYYSVFLFRWLKRRQAGGPETDGGEGRAGVPLVVTRAGGPDDPGPDPDRGPAGRNA